MKTAILETQAFRSGVLGLYTVVFLGWSSLMADRALAFAWISAEESTEGSVARQADQTELSPAELSPAELSNLEGASDLLVAQAFSFFDVQTGFWAEPFITALVEEGILNGFPDGSFQPNRPVTRAQFAAFVQAAFPQESLGRRPQRSSPTFRDVSDDHWGGEAIAYAYSWGFLNGYPDGRFQPDRPISRLEILVALATGLDYPLPTTPEDLLAPYNDQAIVPSYARPRVAAATAQKVVVNYPDPSFLNPQRTATRAEVAVLIYQALVSQGAVAAIDSPYIVKVPQLNFQRIPRGTVVEVVYNPASRILVTPQERTALSLTPVQSGQIPANSTIRGELRPTGAGAQFRATELVTPDGQTWPMAAESTVITHQETVDRETDLSALLQGTSLGAGAAAAIAGIRNGRLPEMADIVGDADFGALIGLFLGRDRVDLLVIEPARDLQLTLTEDLVFEQ